MESIASATSATVVPLVKGIPHAQEAEQSLLGGLLIDPEAISQVEGLVVPEDFYVSKHRAIFQAVLDLRRRGTLVDLVTVGTALTDAGQLANVGGLAYLSSLTDTMPSSANIEAYAGIIKEKSVARSLLAAADEIQKTCFEAPDLTAKERLDRAESLIMSVGQSAAVIETGYVRASETLHDALKTIQLLQERKQSVTGVPTGFIDLDRLTNGLHPGNLVIVAGRPSMGKTAIAMNIALHVAIQTDPVPVGVVSLEMNREELMLRLLSSLSGVDHSRIRTGTLASNEWPLLPPAAARIDAAPLWIDDSPGQSVIDIRARARRLKKEHNIGLLIIDYLQLIHARRERDRREAEISEISRFLKTLAKELNIPVVALSQLNRAPESREKDNKRPRLADLRESGAIEQDADVILFIYRDEVYNKDNDDNKGIAEVIIGKQRNGPTDTVKLSFSGPTVSFHNYYGG